MRLNCTPSLWHYDTPYVDAWCKLVPRNDNVRRNLKSGIQPCSLRVYLDLHGTQNNDFHLSRQRLRVSLLLKIYVQVTRKHSSTPPAGCFSRSSKRGTGKDEKNDLLSRAVARHAELLRRVRTSTASMFLHGKDSNLLLPAGRNRGIALLNPGILDAAPTRRHLGHYYHYHVYRYCCCYCRSSEYFAFEDREWVEAVPNTYPRTYETTLYGQAAQHDIDRGSYEVTATAACCSRNPAAQPCGSHL